MVAIPPALLDSAGLKADSPVEITAQDGRLIVQPKRRRRYTLAELLAQTDPVLERTAEDEAWLNMRPVGREVRRCSAARTGRSTSIRRWAMSSKATGRS
jgi:antitoxin ChpS